MYFHKFTSVILFLSVYYKILWHGYCIFNIYIIYLVSTKAVKARKSAINYGTYSGQVDNDIY